MFDFNCLLFFAAKSLQSCPILCDPIDSRDSPSKNTGVGCHFLLQCMKVKSESEVSQLCLTLSNPMDCSPPGCSAHGIFQARVLGDCKLFGLCHPAQNAELVCIVHL